MQWLLDHADVDARWCLVHATHMTEDEAGRFAHSGAVAGLCPITEGNLGDGIFPAAPYLAAGGAYGVGSDSNVLIDASEELRLLEYGQRLCDRRRSRMAVAGASVGDTLYRAALAGGARALGAPASLAVGNPADFVSLDPDHPSLAARQGGLLTDGWVFAAGRQAIDGVWRRGRRLVTAGRHVDRARISARYRRALGELLA